MLLRQRLGQTPLRDGDLRDGREHAGAHRRLRQHSQARREAVPHPPARGVYSDGGQGRPTGS